MADNALTYEEIEKHLDKYDLKDFQTGGKHHPGAAAQGATASAVSISSICPAYKMVRPILLAVVAFPLVPKKVRDAIKAFMSVLDVICP